MELLDVEGQNQRIEGIGRGVFYYLCWIHHSMTLAWFLQVQIGQVEEEVGKKFSEKKRGHSIEEDEDNKDLQMLNIDP